MPSATIIEQVTFFEDVENTSNPQRKTVDWRRAIAGVSFNQVRSERFTLAPGVTKVLETSAVADLSASPITLVAGVSKPTTYQFRGGFASPWAAALAVAAQNVTLLGQVDGSVLVSGSGLASLARVVPGDQVYLAGAGFGDTGPFALANQGHWVVQAVGTAGLYLRRVDPVDTFVAETVAIASTLDIQHLPDATRPRWLMVRGPAAYSGLFAVQGAASGWLAVTTLAGFVPVTGLTFDRLIASPKFISYVRVESDMPVTLLVGDAAAAVNEVNLIPSGGVAWHESFAFTTSLSVKNWSGLASVSVISAVKE